MCSSSSSAQSFAPFIQEQAPLPLITSPYCKKGDVEWWVSRTKKNPGRHFYKCEHHWKGNCSFWKWEEVYIDVLRAKWPKLFIPVAIHPKQSGTTISLILIVGILNLVAVLHLCLKNHWS